MMLSLMAIAQICLGVASNVNQRQDAISVINSPHVWVRASLGLRSPGTVVRWHGTVFKLWWWPISRVRQPVGRRPVTQEIHEFVLGSLQQLRDAVPYEPPVRFLILDRDSKYGIEVPAAICSMNMRAVRTAVGSPRQNGVAEQWVGNCRPELRTT